MENSILKDNKNILDIFELYKDKIEWNNIIYSEKIPHSILIEFIDYYFNITNRLFLQKIQLSEKLIQAIINNIYSNKNKDNIIVDEMSIWLSLSLNPSLPFITNFDKYYNKLCYNRFPYNINFPMDINFIKKIMPHIQLNDLLDHPFLTKEVEQYIITKKLQRNQN